MSFGRVLRRKNRIEPARNILPAKPIKPAPDPMLLEASALQFQHPDYLDPATSIACSSTRITPQEWPRRQKLSSRSPTQCDESHTPLRPEPSGRMKQGDLSQHAARRSTGNRPGQRLTTDFGVETVRPRRRSRQATSPAAQSSARIQHSPSLLPPPQPDEAKTLPFACPFHKLDPDMYRDCRRYELRRVKDVKQHLSRKHIRLSYCTRCYEVFSTAESLEDHLRSVQSCELRNGPPPSSISKQQWEKLSQQYLSRGKPVEEQWTDIWDILFPGRQPPRSVYLDNYLEEALSRLRAFWSSKRAEITLKTIRQTGPFRVDHPNRPVGVFDQLVDCFLSQFQAETIGLGSSAGTQTEVMSQSSPHDAHEPRWEDNVSTSSTVVGDSSLALDFDDVVQASDLFLGFNVEAPRLWPPPQNIAPLPRSPLSYSSTDSLPESIYESNPSEYSLPLGTRGQRLWIDAPYEVSPVMGGLTGNSMPQLGNLMDMDSQTIPPHHYRHTWAGFTSGGPHFV